VSRRMTSAAAWAAALLCAASLPGCAGRLADLDGSRRITAWISPDGGPGDAVAEVTGTFSLRNRSLGAVRVESVRMPVSTEVVTDPPLPASIAGGRTLQVKATCRFRAADGDAVRTLFLETAGQEPLELAVDGRIKPVPPSDAAAPAPVGSAP
jgi:hypothetical protein